MAAATILHVGEDLCRRIRVMARNGLFVVRTECSVSGLRTSFAKGDIFSAIAFHNDLYPVKREVVLTARHLSRAPLILFKNTISESNDDLFTLVIEVPTPPEVWSKTLNQVIQEASPLHEQSTRLRRECSCTSR